jgi:hypothetical protein
MVRRELFRDITRQELQEQPRLPLEELADGRRVVERSSRASWRFGPEEWQLHRSTGLLNHLLRAQRRTQHGQLARHITRLAQWPTKRVGKSSHTWRGYDARKRGKQRQRKCRDTRGLD